MDPWLESPDLFPSLHGPMSTFMREQLKRFLPRPYFANVNERVYMEIGGRDIEPDAEVYRRNRPPRPAETESGWTGGSSGAATAVAAPVAAALAVTPPVRLRVPPMEERAEPFVEVFRKGEDGHRLVAVIEVLSPGNKTKGSAANESYLRKQAELRDSKVHVIEIDLLRAGLPTTLVAREPLLEPEPPPHDYHVSLRNFADRVGELLMWPIRLSDRLPVIAVPLLPGDGEVPLDLQAVFDRCYDTGPYDDILDRGKPPVPPLSPEQAEWAKGLLSAKAREQQGKGG
jgi:hypothetical protein